LWPRPRITDQVLPDLLDRAYSVPLLAAIVAEKRNS
jgi:hypothetical protein